jgi:drug/metabolite transporter (DMT)-like permease
MYNNKPHANDDEIELQDEQFHDDDASMASSLATMSLVAVRDTVVMAVAHWKVLIFGQVLSFLLACSGAAQATLHYECSLSAPTFSSGLFYSALSLNLIPLYLKGQKFQKVNDNDNDEDEIVCQQASFWFLGKIPLQAPAWIYLIIAFLDVEANYVTVLSFRYTTLASVSLFDSLAIPSAMVLSRLFLGRRHSWIHFIGVVSCMVGVMYNALADYESDMVGSVLDGGKDYPYKLKGDVLAVIGGLLFGASDVLAEMAVRILGHDGTFCYGIKFGASIDSRRGRDITILPWCTRARWQDVCHEHGVPAAFCFRALQCGELHCYGMVFAHE